jgi:hypothetical protein
MLNKFVVELSCEDSSDACDWLDAMHHSKQIARLLDDPNENSLLCELGKVCDDVLGVDEIVTDGSKTYNRFRSSSSLMASQQTAKNAPPVNYDAECNLRCNLFGKMLAMAVLKGTRVVSAEEFDSFFKGKK